MPRENYRKIVLTYLLEDSVEASVRILENASYDTVRRAKEYLKELKTIEKILKLLLSLEEE